MSGLQTGKGAIELCRQVRPDLILLDIMLPDSDGLDICKGIRKTPELAAIPIIFLTARASETDRIVGLELGANDYVVKPFFVRELVARIKLQFRSLSAPPRVIEAGGLELDPTSRQVRLQGAPLALTATEFRLLEFMMSRPGVVFSREQLLNSVWGQDRAITDRAVDVYRMNLRENRPAVEQASARVADYFHHRGLSGASLQQETSRVLGGLATLEGVAHGFRSGLRFLSLMMLAIGLVVAVSLALAARGLRAPPGSGYL